jgi:predicted metal-dependent enzyme (double-stranded beta helix superfamily)
MLDRDELVSRCLAASTDPEPRLAIRDVLHEVVASRPFGPDTIGRPPSGWLDFWYRSPGLTVLNAVWPPHISLYPHDHRMWAAIAIYGGQEDNTFYRRAGGRIEVSGGKELREHDILLMGDDTVHAVTNPLGSYTGAIHVYGGDFVTKPRSQWDPESLVEAPYDIAEVRQVFERAQADFEASESRPE